MCALLLPGAVAHNDVNLLPVSLSRDPIVAARRVWRLALDDDVALTDMVRCDFQVSGFGTLLLNFESANGAVIGSHMQAVANADAAPAVVT